MQIVYYYVLYLKRDSEKEPGKQKIEIHLNPFATQRQAEAYKEKADKKFGDKVHWSGIKKVDLSKHEKGIWLK